MSADEEVFLIPVDARNVIKIPVDQGGPGEELDISQMARAVGPLIAAALRRGGVSHAQLYELSPASQKLLAAASKDEVGSYFRGVLRGDHGRVSHQLQLREISPAPAPSGLDTLLTVQLAGIQAQLGRMEKILNDLALSVEGVVSFLERQQRARSVAALRMVEDVYERTRRTAELSDVDWHRLTGVELELNTQLHAVSDELDDRLGAAEFTKDPKHGVRAMSKVDPGRVSELVQLHRLLIAGQRKLHEVVLLRKVNDGSFDQEELAALRSQLRELHHRHERVLELVDHVADLSKLARARNNWERLFKDGIVLGSRNDDRDLRTIRRGRTVLWQTVLDSEPARVLPAGDTGQLAVARAEATPHS